jgi:hypothetical protein
MLERVSEFSVFCQVTFWPMVNRTSWWSKVAHLVKTRKQRDRGRGQGQDITFKDMFPVVNFQ